MVVRKRLPLTGPAIAFVTTTVKDWIPIFENDEYARTFLNTLKVTLEQFDISLSAYVLMPSHFHCLLGFKQIEYLSKTIQSIKSISSRKIKPLLTERELKQFNKNGNFQFWKPRFDDLIITSEKQYKVKMEYIHNNPVKAGLAENACDFKYSSAGSWTNDEPGYLDVDKSWKWLDE